MKFGLRNTRSLLRTLDNPERRFLSIHIAGTNGKGSTAAFLASVFAESGYKTGLYTSPHLVRFTERIKINGKEISEKELVAYTASLRPEIIDVNATFFEATTCIAFKYFADHEVDIAIIETGLGGRLDSTNVLRPIASVITPIAFDHMEYLGNTLRKIAREKAGIIKRGIPVITSSSTKEVIDVFRSVARKKGSRLIRASERVKVGVARNGRINFNGRCVRALNVTPGLSGEHQVINAQAACATLDVLLTNRTFRRRFEQISDTRIKSGLEHVTGSVNLRGRFEQIIVSGRRVILDVAHNPDGMRILSNSLHHNGISNPVVVFGVMADKEFAEMIRIIGGLTDLAIAVRPENPRALGLQRLVQQMKAAGIAAFNGKSVANGINMAMRIARKGRPIVVTGSHYVVGEALASLDDIVSK